MGKRYASSFLCFFPRLCLSLEGTNLPQILQSSYTVRETHFVNSCAVFEDHELRPWDPSLHEQSGEKKHVDIYRDAKTDHVT